MNIALLYSNAQNRNTVTEHINSFTRYCAGRVFPINLSYGLPGFFPWRKMDAVIIHYTIAAHKFRPDVLKRIQGDLGFLKSFPGPKFLFAQDEYYNSNLMNDFINALKIGILFTLCPETEINKVYPLPRKFPKRILTTLPSLVSNETIEFINRESFQENSKRPIDLGYRARDVPFWIGSLGQKKVQIGIKVEAAAKSAGLTTDISLNPQKTIFGKDWLRFLGRCKGTIGVEGGASVLDHDGSLRERVESFRVKYPEASFEDVKSRFFKESDFQLDYSMITPRHFESISTRTAMILIEGKYSGILEPGRHYFPLKDDYSNLFEVLENFKDHEKRTKIIETAYEDIIEKGAFNYSNFFKGFNSLLLSESSNKTHSNSAAGIYIKLWAWEKWGKGVTNLEIHKQKVSKNFRKIFNPIIKFSRGN